MFKEWTFILACAAVMGCNPPLETAPQSNGTLEPVWASHFHWEEGGRVLVLEGEEDLRIVHDAPRPGEVHFPAGASLATWSTTHVSLIEAYGGLGAWAGGTGCKYLQSEAALSRIASGEAIDYGSDAGEVLEQLLWHPPGGIAIFPFYDPFEGLALPEGMPVLPIQEYLESHPLGRAEWMRVFGWLSGQSAQADSAFFEVERKYIALREQAAQVVGQRKRLDVFTGSIDGDAFWAPSGGSFISTFLEDAGVNYVFSDDLRGGSIPISFESLLHLNDSVDTWGLIWRDEDSITWKEIADTHPIFSQLAPKSSSIFAANTRTCDYFGAMVAEPDVLLGDLVALFHGESEDAGCFNWIATQ